LEFNSNSADLLQLYGEILREEKEDQKPIKQENITNRFKVVKANQFFL